MTDARATRLAIGLMAATLALTACGSGDTGASTQPAPTESATAMTQPATLPERPATVEALAAQLGCASVEPAEKIFALASAQCALPNGSRVEIAVFPSSQARDQYLEIGRNVSPAAPWAIGDTWSAGGPGCTEEDLTPLT